jgi:ubiquitin thioesterase protein OTUB1
MSEDYIQPRSVEPTEPIASAYKLYRYDLDFTMFVNKLEMKFSHWRRIRGDGNCYYRAVGVGLLEMCVAEGPASLSEFIGKAFSKQDYFRQIPEYPWNAQLFCQQLRHLLHNVSQSPAQGRAALESSLLDAEFDDSLVKLVRITVANYLLDNLKKLEDFIAGESAYKIITETLSMRAEAEGVMFSAAPVVFNCNITHISANATELRTDLFRAEQVTARNLTIWYRFGHYDLLYVSGSPLINPLAYHVPAVPHSDPSASHARGYHVAAVPHSDPSASHARGYHVPAVPYSDPSACHARGHPTRTGRIPIPKPPSVRPYEISHKQASSKYSKQADLGWTGFSMCCCGRSHPLENPVTAECSHRVSWECLVLSIQKHISLSQLPLLKCPDAICTRQLKGPAIWSCIQSLGLEAEFVSLRDVDESFKLSVKCPCIGVRNSPSTWIVKHTCGAREQLLTVNSCRCGASNLNSNEVFVKCVKCFRHYCSSCHWLYEDVTRLQVHDYVCSYFARC